MPRSTRFIAAHPIVTFIGYFAILALVDFALVPGGAKTWPIFVVFGVFLPIALIAKARRQVRAAHTGEPPASN